MSRIYVKKRPQLSYIIDDVKAAVDDIINRRRLYRNASAHYGVPRSVINHRIIGRKTSPDVLGQGRPTALDKNTESQLADLIMARAEFGYPMDKENLYDFVKEFCQVENIKTPFTSPTPPKERQIRLKQLKYGEVLTSEYVLHRLQEEE